MIILKRIEIKNFRNIKEAILDKCGDFNIIIGPPNCGKTNILNAINTLTKSYWEESSSFHNYIYVREVNLIFNDNFKFAPLRCEGVNRRDSYLEREAFKINFEFDEGYVKDLFIQTKKTNTQKILEAIDLLLEFLEFLASSNSSKDLSKFEEEMDKQNIREFFTPYLSTILSTLSTIPKETLKKIKEFISTIKNSKCKISLVQDAFSKNYALPDSLSLLHTKGIFEHIKVLLIEDNRIREYKAKPLREHIKDKNMSSEEVAKLVELIKKMLDPYLADLTTGTFDFKKEIETEEFQTPIEEQGSGIRSLICSLADIISLGRKPSIILFDEPEIGLHPLAKQKLLEFLLTQSENHQIFITTHDPAFVNPLFWKDRGRRVSIYFYSISEGGFVKINIEENRENPNIFAGYLPHTHSLKDIHIYVEGSSDVYIFQVFLHKYINKLNIINKYEIINKVGIYHLGGDFWEHLLYTIPQQPYKCFVILDGDKKERVKEVVEKYNSNLITEYKFKLCATYEEIAEILSQEEAYSKSIPIYCLKKDRIEDYLFPDGLPPNFNKGIDGPAKAEELENIPEEIEKLFKVIFGQIIVFQSKKSGILRTKIMIEKMN